MTILRNSFLIFLTLLLYFTPALLTGQTLTWDGGGDGTSWTDANNWNPDTAPTNGVNVIFDNVTATITGIPAGFFVTNFTKSGTGTVTLNSDLQIRGNLVVSGGGFVGGTGTTITFNGTGPQNIGGAGSTTFHNLVVENNGTSSTTFFSYSINNPTTMQGSIIVNNDMQTRLGVVSFCSATGATFNHLIKGNLVLGSASSSLTILSSPFQIISNTEFVVNHGTNSHVTLTIEGDLLLPAGQGGATAALTTPSAIGGSSVLNVLGNVNLVDTIYFSMNGRNNFVVSPSFPTPNPITMNVGQPNTATGNFIMSNGGSIFIANASGTFVPTLNLLGARFQILLSLILSTTHLMVRV